MSETQSRNLLKHTAIIRFFKINLCGTHLYYNIFFCIDGVLITPFQGSTTAGENYTLECSTGGAIATFEWLGPPDGRTPVVNSSSVTIISNSSSSQLQFRPLQHSHNGSYSCRTTTHEDPLQQFHNGSCYTITDEDALSSELIAIRVNGNNMQYYDITPVLRSISSIQLP